MKKVLVAMIFVFFIVTLFYAKTNQKKSKIIGNAILSISEIGLVSCNLIAGNNKNRKLEVFNEGYSDDDMRTQIIKVENYEYKNIKYYDFKLNIKDMPYGATVKRKDVIEIDGKLFSIVLQKDLILAAMHKSSESYVLESGTVISFRPWVWKK